MKNYISQDSNSKLSTMASESFCWMKLAFIALALSGFFAIFLVIGRSPKVNEMLPHVDFFRLSLSIHVNLSVYVWLTAGSIFCVLHRFCSENPEKMGIIKSYKLSFYILLASILMMCFAIFDYNATSYLNNYIPIVDDMLFKFGLILFSFVVSIYCILLILRLDFEYFYAEKSLLIIILLSYLSLDITFIKLTEYTDILNTADYYEYLFWPAGHILQFAYVQLLLICWNATLVRLSNGSKKYNRLLKLLSAINLVSAILGCLVLFFIDAMSFEFKDIYTKQMIYFGGASSIIFLISIIWNKNIMILFGKSQNATVLAKKALFWSIVLFMSGGFIALFIDGINTIIPAHYHGSIIGVSLSLMAYYYLYLYDKSTQLNISFKYFKLAKVQPAFYGIGQLIHITGFALSGGYGALRKTPVMMESFEGKLYMGLMGFGGLVSIIGGLLFVIVVARNILHIKKSL